MEQVARSYLRIPQVLVLGTQSPTDFAPFFQPSLRRAKDAGGSPRERISLVWRFVAPLLSASARIPGS
jgi:hypothetical protein